MTCWLHFPRYLGMGRGWGRGLSGARLGLRIFIEKLIPKIHPGFRSQDLVISNSTNLPPSFVGTQKVEKH